MKKNLLNEKLTTAIIAELSDETNEALALRRALLHCVLLLEDAKDPAVRDFVDYLLVEFRPLASEFVDEKHPYLTAFNTLRGRLHTGHLAILLPLERVRAWLAAT
jgi:hypothetical protein